MNYKALIEHGFAKRLRQLRSGLSGSMPADHVFMQTGGNTPVSAFIAHLDAYLALVSAAHSAEIALKQARIRLLAATPSAYAMSENARALIRAYHGAAHPVLKSFGIAPKKRRKLKVTEELAAGIRRGETRKIRGTLGPKERLKLRAPKDTLTYATGRSNDLAKKPQGEK